MNGKKRKMVTASMLLYELRNVMGNPFVHIFGVGMPIFLAVLISKIIASEIADASLAKTAVTAVFLGMGALIPMATTLIGYAVQQAQDIEKGIPERLQLFGIRNAMSICNRAISELIYILAAFVIYFIVGIFAIGLQAPTVAGAVLYMFCILVFALLCFLMANGISFLVKKFSATYCVSMMIYFACMFFSGSMGMSFDNMSGWMQAVAKLIPVTYINRDFINIWTGKSYDFMPMLQSYLFFGAVGGILLFVAIRKNNVKIR